MSHCRLGDAVPMIWGTISDYWGRRPIMLACLTTLALSCVGLALVPTSSYWLLMLMRGLQAAGSASTVALGMYLVRQASQFCDSNSDIRRRDYRRHSHTCRTRWFLWCIWCGTYSMCAMRFL
jgi:Na+/melibiose symporter-like transporter